MSSLLRLAAALLATVLLACLPLQPARAAGGYLTPALLPPLGGPLPQPGEPDRTPVADWQLDQHLSFGPDGRGRLSLNPSWTVALTDPQRKPREALDRQQRLAELHGTAAALRDDALLLHRLFLSLQHNAGVRQLLSDWRAAHVEAASGGDASAAWLELGLARLDLELQQLEAEKEFLQLRLNLLELPGTPAPGHRHVPVLGLPGEPVPECLSRSPELARLEVMEELEVLQAVHELAGRELKADLRAGLSLDLSPGSAAGPGFAAGWSISLAVRRADYGGPALDFSAGSHGFSQSFSVRREAPVPPPASAGNHAREQLRNAETLALLALLDALAGAGGRLALAARETELAFSQLYEAEQTGTVTATATDQAFDAALTELRLQAEHDTLLLEVAAACRFPLHWEAVMADMPPGSE